MGLENKSVLVTGGAGFIGSHLVDRLIQEKPSKIVIVDSAPSNKEPNLQEAKRNYPKLKIYSQDASDYENMSSIIKNEGTQVVFNLAAVGLLASFMEPKWTYQQNINITLCLCELAKNGYFDTLIHFSSSQVYGSCEYAPMDEKHPLNPATPYAASKVASDSLILSYMKTFGIGASIIRPFNIYGPRQRAGLIPTIIRRILADETLVIYGDGEQAIDFIYVSDVVNAAIEIYNHPGTRGKVLNVGSGRETSINTVVKLIAQYMGYDKAIAYERERAGDVRRQIASIKLAQNLINFKPRINLEDGIKLTIDWYKRFATD